MRKMERLLKENNNINVYILKLVCNCLISFNERQNLFTEIRDTWLI